MLFLVFIAVVVILVIFFVVRSGKKEEIYKETQQTKLKRDYLLALQGMDRQYALSCGRKYYAYLHNNTNGVYTNTLNASIEQRLANDIAVMKNENEIKTTSRNKETYNILLLGFADDRKIKIMKKLMDLKQIGVGAAKDMVEKCPVQLMENIPKDEAVKIEKDFNENGGIIMLQ
jgi:ribosomal protein L7/L12